jgi:AbrB family looped-hinge helix DNA binding protein
MTVMMTARNQITIPKKIAAQLHLGEGSLFDIQINGTRLELVPLETVERKFTDEEYAKLDELCRKERNTAKPVSSNLIKNLKTGKV